MDFGNASDIVSALCNVAMACAAVYAALNAKEWISGKLNNDLYTLSKDIIVENHESIFKNFKTSARSAWYHSIILADKRGDKRNNDLPSLQVIEKELNKIEDIYKTKANLESNIRMLRKLGFVYEKKRTEYLVDELEKIYFGDFIMYLNGYWIKLRLHVYNLSPLQSTDLVPKELHIDLLEFNEFIQSTIVKIEKLYTEFDELYSSPIKYFQR